MLKKISVSNFKGFKDEFVFDLGETNGYSFNQEAVINGIVNNAIVYGANGVGKSNLGLAIFDLISHLTDLEGGNTQYVNYKNAYDVNGLVSFKFEYDFDGQIVLYNYSKRSREEIVKEEFFISDKRVAYLEKTTEKTLVEIDLKGTETLNKDLSNNNISLLKYIKNNAILIDDFEKEVFYRFFNFIEGMLYYRSTLNDNYLGLVSGNISLDDDIIENGYLKDFEVFLNKVGIECKLDTVTVAGKKEIVMNFEHKQVRFFNIASSGTIALTLFYFWYHRIKNSDKVKFIFIDEFDAFYHQKLAKLIVEILKKTGVQFVLTTHNTSIMTNDLLRPDCYFIMDNKQIKSLANLTNKELREAHNIEKMYKANSFNINV
ncbi:ATP/GTP-binding protein [Flammeovirga sp. EKP202]|uniref:AAA family ATPase n=1 Tax=Flammeovirga sp. EKP202 TaxID=2770592 RepID=UPI00165EC13B|nr:ATP-binding protein [Flammeovirga sp. EKP202]MBD0402928.1 ATP-binding protein [Flammeovirga sp. EKP202]